MIGVTLSVLGLTTLIVSLSFFSLWKTLIGVFATLIIIGGVPNVSGWYYDLGLVVAAVVAGQILARPRKRAYWFYGTAS